MHFTLQHSNKKNCNPLKENTHHNYDWLKNLYQAVTAAAYQRLKSAVLNRYALNA